MKLGLRRLNDISKKYRELFLKDIEDKNILLEDVKVCICCNDSSFEVLLEVDRFDLPFGSLLCKECGLITTSPRIKQEALPYYYEKYYHALNYGKENLNDQVALFKKGQGEKIYEKLKPYIKDRRKLSILEIGAGVGSVLDEFRMKAITDDLKIKLLGTEYSLECIKQCKKRNINVINGNASTVLALDEKFDVIILSHVFEHFIDLKNELEVLNKLLKKSGLLYIEVPGILEIHNKGYYDFSFLGFTTHAHMYNFTLQTLKNVIEKFGYTLVYGNEEVSSIFQLNKMNISTQISKTLDIKSYFKFLNINQSFAVSQKLQIESQKKQIKIKSKKLKILENKLDKYIAKECETKNLLHDMYSQKIFKNPIKKYKAYKQLYKVISNENNNI